MKDETKCCDNCKYWLRGSYGMGECRNIFNEFCGYRLDYYYYEICEYYQSRAKFYRNVLIVIAVLASIALLVKQF